MILLTLQAAESVPVSFDLVSKFGPTGVLLIFFGWFMKWLPGYLEKQAARQDVLVATFQAEAKFERDASERRGSAEREACDRRFDRLADAMCENRDAIVSAIRDRKP